MTPPRPSIVVSVLLLGLVLALVACGPPAIAPTLVPAPSTSSAASSGPAGTAPARVDLATMPELEDALFQPGACGGYESRALVTAPAKLLGGRLTIRAVEGLESNPRPYDIMSAPEADESESRLFLASGDSQLVVFVEELFTRAGPHPLEDIVASDRYAKDANIGRLDLDGLSAIAVLPKKMVPDHEKAVALRLYVVTVDDLLVRVTFAVTPDVVPASSGCAHLARSMAKTIASGGRKVDLRGGVRKLDGGVTISLPENVALVAQQGPDFVVYHAYVVTTLDAADGTFNVYFGGYPSRPQGAETSEGTLLGESVTWVEETIRSGARGRQALVAVPGSDGLFMHVFYGAKSPAVLDAFAAMSASLTKQ